MLVARLVLQWVEGWLLAGLSVEGCWEGMARRLGLGWVVGLLEGLLVGLWEGLWGE